MSGQLQMAEEGFFQLLSRAQHGGELARHKDPRALARVLVTMMQCTIVMIKAGTPTDVVRQTAETALSILDSRTVSIYMHTAVSGDSSGHLVNRTRSLTPSHSSSSHCPGDDLESDCIVLDIFGGILQALRSDRSMETHRR